MPKNKGKGGKNRRRGKNENENEKRDLIYKEEGQEYAQVVKILGNGYVDAMCFDGVKRLCHIRGKMRKKVWVIHGDIVLVGLRDFQDSRADIIHKYSAVESKRLKANNCIPDSVRLLENATVDGNANDEDDEIYFDYTADTEVEVNPRRRDFYAGISDDDSDDEYDEDGEDEEKYNVEDDDTNIDDFEEDEPVNSHRI